MIILSVPIFEWCVVCFIYNFINFVKIVYCFRVFSSSLLWGEQATGFLNRNSFVISKRFCRRYLPSWVVNLPSSRKQSTNFLKYILTRNKLLLNQLWIIATRNLKEDFLIIFNLSELTLIQRNCLQFFLKMFTTRSIMNKLRIKSHKYFSFLINPRSQTYGTELHFCTGIRSINFTHIGCLNTFHILIFWSFLQYREKNYMAF